MDGSKAKEDLKIKAENIHMMKDLQEFENSVHSETKLRISLKHFSTGSTPLSNDIRTITQLR